MQRMGIYIHIPFCVRKCRYCDFLSFPAAEREKDRYVQALLEEIRREAERYQDAVVDSVFIGGGTPTVLAEGALEGILAWKSIRQRQAENGWNVCVWQA